MTAAAATGIPRPVAAIMGAWELARMIYPAGTNDKRTRTYLYKRPGCESWAMIQIVGGTLTGFATMTTIELHALGDVA